MGYDFAITSFFRRVSETTPPKKEAGTEKRHSDRPAENNRPYVAERVSHTAASRETVLTVSAPTGFKSRLPLGNPPSPLKNQERTDVMNESKNKNLFIRVSEKETTIIEQNAGGILSDERFTKMLQNYEKEQKSLTQEVEENRQTLQNAEQRIVDLRLVLRTLREMTDIKELTPTLFNSLIERIEAHNNDKSSGHSHVKVDIYFTAVGMIDIPTEKELLATMEEIRNNPQDFKFVA